MNKYCKKISIGCRAELAAYDFIISLHCMMRAGRLSDATISPLESVGPEANYDDAAMDCAESAPPPADHYGQQIVTSRSQLPKSKNANRLPLNLHVDLRVSKRPSATPIPV